MMTHLREDILKVMADGKPRRISEIMEGLEGEPSYSAVYVHLVGMKGDEIEELEKKGVRRIFRLKGSTKTLETPERGRTETLDPKVLEADEPEEPEEEKPKRHYKKHVKRKGPALPPVMLHPSMYLPATNHVVIRYLGDGFSYEVESDDWKVGAAVFKAIVDNETDDSV